jgi:hypothetical protein
MRRAIDSSRSGVHDGRARRSPAARGSALPHRLLAAALVLTAAAVPWLVPSGARACSCVMPPPPEQALEEADAVLQARAFAMRNDDMRAYYRFEVDRVWKGDVGSHVEISTPLHAASCGRSYAIGTQYVIYARRSASGELTDMLCTRTRAMSSAAEDLEVLGPGHAPYEQPVLPADAGPEPTEPPRIELSPVGVAGAGASPVEPPPGSPSSRGCAVEKPHDAAGAGTLAMLGLFAVAIGRRRAVGSARRRPKGHAA